MIGFGISPADNGNFYFINKGSIYMKTQVIKINPYGDTIWSRLIDSIYSYTGVSSGDGGYVITGVNARNPPFYGNYTVKLNSSGNIIWNKIYDTIPSNCWKIIRTENNTYAVCGNSYGNGLIFTIDSVGNLIWHHLYPSLFNRAFYAICSAHNGGYVAVGHYDSTEFDLGCGVIDRVDSQGNLIWEKKYYLYQSNRFTSINRINGGYILTPILFADTAIQASRAGIIKIDTSGNLNFLKIIYDDTNLGVSISDLKIITPNEYIMCGGSVNSTLDTVSAIVYITDSLGNILKKGKFSETQNSQFEECYVINNNDFIFIGLSDYLYPNEYYNSYVVRTDTNFHAPPIGIRKEDQNIPVSFKLYPNYPNPFNPSTKIRFEIPLSPLSSLPAFARERGVGGFITLKVYDIIGRVVAVLVDNQLRPGKYEVDFDGANLSSGIYFYQLRSGNFIQSKKMVLLK
jgi:hypothetical protein